MVDKLAKYGTAIKIFGAVLFALCAAGIIWSLFRPAVTHGPMPPEPAPFLAKAPDAQAPDARPPAPPVTGVSK
jgi:hypothetical protein